MTISSNHNGTVVKTSGKGFSVKNIYNKIKNWAKENATIIDCNVANTGSCYIKFTFNNIDYDIRVSNHTKRSFDIEIKKDLTIDTYPVWVDPRNKDLGMEDYSSCDFEILNSETKITLFSHLGIK